MASFRLTVATAIGIAFFASIAESLPASAAPSVVSINLCSDQLALSLADRPQLLSVSWLAADPEESLLAANATGLTLNYGTAEEILRLDPDVVIAGKYTGTFTKSVLAKLGYKIVDVEPAQTVEDIARNVRKVGAAIGQRPRAEARVAAMYEALEARKKQSPARPLSAVVVRPGGFTSGRPSLADSLLRLAGVSNAAVDQGLDRWGSLSLETLLRAEPELIVIIDYRAGEASLAGALLEHPAVLDAGIRAATIHVPARLWACGLPESLSSIDLITDAARNAEPQARMSRSDVQ